MENESKSETRTSRQHSASFQMGPIRLEGLPAHLMILLFLPLGLGLAWVAYDGWMWEANVCTILQNPLRQEPALILESGEPRLPTEMDVENDPRLQDPSLARLVVNLALVETRLDPQDAQLQARWQGLQVGQHYPCWTQGPYPRDVQWRNPAWIKKNHLVFCLAGLILAALAIPSAVVLVQSLSRPRPRRRVRRPPSSPET